MRPSILATRFTRSLKWLAAASSGVVFGGGCSDPEIQTLIWGGLNELAVTLVDALFLIFAPDPEEAAPVTVQAITDALTAWLC